LTLFLAGCPAKKDDGAASGSATSGATSAPKTPTQKPTASAIASAAPPEPPSPVDLQKKTWTQGGKTVELVMTDLSNSCVMAGVSLLLPKSAPMNPLMESRGCVIRAWGGDTGPYIFIINDELSKLKEKSELKGIKRFFEETPETFLAEDDDAKVGFFGMRSFKAGARTYHCQGVSAGAEHGDEIVRGMLKLCSTMTVVSPK
jgi:hypothetical protein